jgi:hydrogenase expression/formation protein HypC
MCLGIPGLVVAITDRERMTGTVDVLGTRREVNLICVAEPEALDEIVGAWVLVHVGFAMSRIDPAAAAATLQALEELGELMEQMEAMRASEAALGETRP